MTQSALSLSNTPGGTKAPKSLLSVVSTILRRRGGTLIGIPDNALGEGNPNLLSSPEFAGGLADAPTRTGLVALSSIAGYDNALAFGHDGSTLTLAYKNFTPVVGLTYTVSATVKMDDGLAPTFASPPSASSANTFAFVFANDPYLPTIVAANSDGTYRVSATVAAPSTLSGLGVIKYPANNNRTFKVTGYKLELGSVATPYTPQSILRQRGTYQDSTGTMALSTVGEVLGLLTDRLGVLGPELFNVTLNFSDAAWTKTAAVISTGANTFATNGFGGCHAYVTAQGAKTYAVRVVGTTTVSTTFRNAAGASGAFTVPAGAFDTGSNSQILLENGSLYIQLASAGTINITSISVKEIPGNHATQPTPAQKPTLVRVPKRLGQNRITNGTFDVDTSGWTSAGGVHTWVAGVLRRTTGQGDAGSYQDVSGLTPGKPYQFRPKMSNITLVNGVAAYVYVGPGFGALIGSVLGTTQIPLVFTATSSTVRVYLYTNSTSAADFDDIEVCEVLEWTNAISFNGSGQSLITPIATGNEGWLCAAVTFGGAAGVNETIFANGAGAAAQKGVWLTRNGQGGGEDYFRMGVGNGTELAMVTTIFPRLRGTPRVVEGGWTASSVFVGVDGNISSTTRTGDATPAPNPSLIGAYLPTTHVLNGPMTAFLHCQTVPTEAERDTIRKWMASTNRAPYWGELPTLSLDFASGVYVVSNGEI